MGWYYPQPQPTQLAPHVVQASTGQNPPVKVLAATAAAILTLWPVGYDHSAYGQNYRPKQTAPLTLVFGARPPPTSFASFYSRRAQWTETTWTLSQTEADSAPISLVLGQAPPITSRALLYGQRAQWLDATWTSPQSPPEAAIVPRADNPPLVAASPVFVKDPARPIYGLTWQYGTQNAKGDFSGWSTPPLAQAPPIIGSSVPDALASWSNPTWPAQDLTGPLVQPYPGDEPPGITSSTTDLAAFGYYDGWAAQRLAFATTEVPPPIVSQYLPPNDFPYSALVAWQAAPTWTAQTQSDVQPLAPFIYGSQPAPNSIATAVAIRASWADASWLAQSADTPAAIAPVPVVNAPPAPSVANLYAIRTLWIQPIWLAQSAPDFTASGPLPVFVPAAPPSLLTVLNWPATTWSAQNAPDFTAPALPMVPAGLSNLAAIFSWSPVSWAAQSAHAFTTSSAVVVPTGPQNIAAVLAWTPAAQWLSQSAPANAGWNVPRVDAPPQRSLSALFALRASWSDPIWNAQGDIQTISWFGAQQILIGSPRYIIKRIRARRWIVSATTYLQFDPKAPDENVKLTFDFSPDLPSGITLTGVPVITYAVQTGTDLTPSLLANGTPGFDFTRSKVIVPIQGGINAVDYAIHALCPTTDPLLSLSLTGILSVRA